jgi:hypothetical protein
MNGEIIITLKRPITMPQSYSSRRETPSALNVALNSSSKSEGPCPLNVALKNTCGERRCYLEVRDFEQHGKKLSRTPKYRCTDPEGRPIDHKNCPYLKTYTGSLPEQNIRYEYKMEDYTLGTGDQVDYAVDPVTGLSLEDLRNAYRDPVPLPPKPEDEDGAEVYTLSKF